MSLYNQPSSKVNYGLVHTYDDLVTKVMDILENTMESNHELCREIKTNP